MKHTFENLVNEFNKRKLNEKFELISYNAEDDRILLKCKTCKNISNKSWKDFLNHKQYNCRFCYIKNIKSPFGKIRNTEEFKKKLIDNGITNIEVIGEYINSRSKIKCKCLVCGNIWDARADQVSSSSELSRRGCPVCGREKTTKALTHTTDKFKADIYKKHGDMYTLLSEYVKDSIKVKIKCNKCNHEFYCLPQSIKRYYPTGYCPICKESILETIIANTLNEYGIKYNTEVEFSGCVYKSNLKFDFQIFKDDNTYFLLEVDGTQHFENVFKKPIDEFNDLKIRDHIKDEFCQNNSIQLYRIEVTENITVNSAEIQNSVKNCLLSILQDEGML